MHTPGRPSAAGLPQLAFAFLAGVSCIYALPQLPPLWVFLPGFLCVLLLRKLAPSVRWTLLALLLAASWACFLGQQRLGERLDPELNAHDLWLTGEITELPERQGNDWRFVFAPEQGSVRRVRVTWYRAGRELHGGDCWRFELRMRQPRGLSNPGGFDYEAWLFREGIGATAYVRSAESCSPAQQTSRSWFAHSLLVLRQDIVDKTQKILPDHPMLGFVLGLTVGDASAISDAQWLILRRTGTTHIVSISGLHVALVAGVLFFLARWMWALIPGLCVRLPAQQAAAVLAVSGALIYSLLAGMSIPTQRSLIMLLVALGAIALRREGRSGDLFALALLAVLLCEPAAVLYPGFWLSFGAIAWIGYIGSGRVGRPQWWKALLTLQLSLSVALVPMCLYWFGEASLVGPVANFVLIPVYSVLTPWLLAGVLLLDVWPWAANELLRSGAWGLDISWRGLEWLASLDFAYFTWPAPGLTALVLATAGLLLLLAPRGFPARLLGLVFWLPLAIPTYDIPVQGTFDLVVLDVGQGLSAVLRTQKHVLLFDTGPAARSGSNAGDNVVLPYLRQAGIHTLDVLVLSHADMDHRGGLVAVRAGMHVNHEIGTDHGPACRAGEKWDWDGVHFEFLHPPAGEWSDNNGSCVLRVAAGEHAVLLTGDIEAEAENSLLLSGRNLSADVMVVPHHGSPSSSTAGFVGAVHPRYALIPAGWSNRWGFPNTEVVERYRSEGAEVAVAGLDGALRIRIDAAGAHDLRGWREESMRFWNLK